MQRILKILVASAEQANWNNQGTYIADNWTPAPPKLLDRGEYDLVSDVIDEIPGWIVGRDRDTLIEQRNLLERLLVKAARVQADLRHAGACELEMADSGATYSVKAPLKGGGITLTTDLAQRKDGKLAQKATLKVVRGPVWEGPETTVTPTTAISNNGIANIMILPALSGDLPARCRLCVTASGGNSANIQAILVALRHHGNINYFYAKLTPASMSAGWTITAGTDTVVAADPNFVSGNRMRYTPNAGRTGEQLLARWEYSGANVVDQLTGPGGLLPIVRYRDNATSPNFSLRMRTGVKVGSSYQYGAWSNPEPVTDLFASSAATVELGSLLLGSIRVPGVGGGDQVPQTLVYELWITATAVTGSFDVDYVERLVLGESGDGRGLASVEFPAGLGTNRAYLDSRLRKDLAYLTDTSDVYLCSASDVPDGGEIWLWPQTVQRLDVWAMRNRDNLCKHQGNTTLAASLTYVPRYIRDRGTT